MFLSHDVYAYLCFLDMQVLSVILPSLVLLLEPHQMPPTPMHKLAITQILQIASINPSSFKKVTLALKFTVREILEISVKHALGEVKLVTSEQIVKPQISLRSF